MGSYSIVRQLARGGMAELFLARSRGPEGFEKLVVLKKTLPRYSGNPRFESLLIDEAKLAASFDHPNIVSVYDMGRIDGHYFFAMEYVHGQDLRSVLRRSVRELRTTPIARAVHIARDIASALHHAHERKRSDGTLREVIHRDISPSNVLISYDGAIKLADFGVAKAATSSTKTRTGSLKGKVSYLSPEQARGQPIDRRSDIFSLGVVMWEMVTLRRLFKSDNDLATIQAIIHSAGTPLRDVRPDCPPELERIVAKALAKDRDERYQTAQQLQVDLEELAREHKLDQSSVTLGRWVSELFDNEIAAWLEAQANGATVTEYLVAAGGPPVALEEVESSKDAPFAEASEPEPEADDDDLQAPTIEQRRTGAVADALAGRLPSKRFDDDHASTVLSAPRFEDLATTLRAEPVGDEATALAPPPIMSDVMAALEPSVSGVDAPTLLGPGVAGDPITTAQQAALPAKPWWHPDGLTPRRQLIIMVIVVGTLSLLAIVGSLVSD